MKRKKNWPDDWLKMTAGDKAAFHRVKTYCIGDVITLEKVYQKLLMFAKPPNLSIVKQEEVCTNCGGENYIRYGSFFTPKNVHQRYRCKDCSTVFHQGQFAKQV
jgi:rRNA maturation protein Nop10